ncbi:cilia- and flagella-associated protein 45-like [Octopus sinensis]|uniref:Cilia- and flagella-associated protein 45-like n=1 Tax=Octopus sinensis TaxID=2607531 RepID=A0A7E6FNF6_9MOLL|nr:cilia- and flagella-associated protein 45-like [Octopus sinensis]
MLEQMGKKKRKKQQREMIRLISNNYIRDMIIPRQHVERPAITLDCAEYERIKENSRNMAEKLKAEGERLVKEQEQKLSGVAERKKHLQKCQIKTDYDLGDVSENKASSILAEANQRIFERDMEIKIFNELIEDAKSHATHDLQVKEKHTIEQHNVAEDKLNRLQPFTPHAGIEHLSGISLTTSDEIRLSNNF